MASFTEILRHSRNYFIANISTRALAFISIPVYTRLLSPDEYGIVSIFFGVAAILSCVMSLGADRSISRYYFDQKNIEDFRCFTGTSSILALAAFVVNATILAYFAKEFGSLVGLNANVVYLLVPTTLINIIGLTFEQIYGPQKESKKIALSSLARVYAGFALSIFFILLLKDEKYMGQIAGQIFAGIILCIYWIKEIKRYLAFSFDLSYVKYIFVYSVPLIPYALSAVIIEQFGKLAIGGTQGVSQAGFYSLALAVSSLVGIAISVAHQAWNPYFFEYMNAQNYAQLDKDFRRIFIITIIIAAGVAAFGKEIGLLLAKKEFGGSFYLIPIFTFGYIFFQLSYVYLRNFGYSKKTYFMTLTVLMSGLSNIAMNFILIKKYGEFGAAVSFTLSYVFMAALGWFFNKFFVKLHAPALKTFLFPIFIIIPFYLLFYLLKDLESWIYSLLIKGCLLCLAVVFLFWKDKEEIVAYVKRHILK